MFLEKDLLAFYTIQVTWLINNFTNRKLLKYRLEWIAVLIFLQGEKVMFHYRRKVVSAVRLASLHVSYRNIGLPTPSNPVIMYVFAGWEHNSGMYASGTHCRGPAMFFSPVLPPESQIFGLTFLHGRTLRNYTLHHKMQWLFLPLIPLIIPWLMV